MGSYSLNSEEKFRGILIDIQELFELQNAKSSFVDKLNQFCVKERKKLKKIKPKVRTLLTFASRR